MRTRRAISTEVAVSPACRMRSDAGRANGPLGLFVADESYDITVRRDPTGEPRLVSVLAQTRVRRSVALCVGRRLRFLVSALFLSAEILGGDDRPRAEDCDSDRG